MTTTNLDREKLRELGHSARFLFIFKTYYGPAPGELAQLGGGSERRGRALVERVWREVEHDERYASDFGWAVRVLGRSEVPAAP